MITVPTQRDSARCCVGEREKEGEREREGEREKEREGEIEAAGMGRDRIGLRISLPVDWRRRGRRESVTTTALKIIAHRQTRYDLAARWVCPSPKTDEVDWNLCKGKGFVYFRWRLIVSMQYSIVYYMHHRKHHQRLKMFFFRCVWSFRIQQPHTIEKQISR